MAGRRTPARGRRAAPGGLEPEVPSDYAAPGEGEFLSEEVERQIEDIRAGRTRLTRYPSVDEYLEHVDRVISE